MIQGHAASAWRYRHFISSAIAGEMKSRFVRSKIGALWHILHPMAMATIYALVLSKVLGAKLGASDNPAAFAIYLISGMAVWGLFSEIANRSLTIFIDYANTLKKIAFPRIALPLVILGGALLNHAFFLIAAFIVFALFAHLPAATALALPLGAMVAAGLAFGLGVLTGVLNVFSRDVGQVMGVVLQIWFWLTPIVYTRDILPDGMKPIIDLNPMSPVALWYQQALTYQTWPDPMILAYPAALAIALCAAAMFVFRRASGELVDAL